MTDAGKRVLELALMLSREERVEVAAKLVHSVNAFAEAEQAWCQLIDRRARRILREESAAEVPRARGGVCIDIEAEVDLELAVSWYEQNQPSQVSVLLDQITDALQRIRRKPDSYGRLTGVADELDVHRIFLREFPYALAFVKRDDEIRVLAVAHTYRRPVEREITIGALLACEQWLSANGVRALTAVVVAGLAQ